MSENIEEIDMNRNEFTENDLSVKNEEKTALETNRQEVNNKEAQLNSLKNEEAKILAEAELIEMALKNMESSEDESESQDSVAKTSKAD